MSIDSKNSLVRSGSKCCFTRSGAGFRVASAIVALGLLLAPAASGQGPGDCLILGPITVECGATQGWLGSIPVAQNTYSSSWSIINNNTGAAIIGASSCASVPVPIGACPVSVNVGTVGTFTLKLSHVTSMGAMPMCTRLITVTDTTPPVISCPPNVNVECGASTDPSATGMPTAVDCSPVTFSHTDSAGATNCAGTAIIRVWIGTDSSGNVSLPCTQIITIVDTTPPSITCPGAVSVQCFSQVPAPNIGSVTTSDTCGHPVTVTHMGDSASNGTSSCNNVITRTYKATDTCGNMNTCTQLITVNDTTDPTVTCPGPVSVQCFSQVPAPNIGSVTSSDNCGGTVTVVHLSDAASNGTSSCNNVITRTYQGTDACGNTNTCTQLITVNDTTDPQVNCPGPVAVQCFSQVPAANIGSVSASDNCGGTVTVVHLSDVASNGTSSCNNIITRTYQGTDACGNTMTCLQTITVNDTTPPTLTCAPINLQCYSQIPPPSTVPATDNCGGSVTVTHVGDSAPSNGTSNCNNVIIRTYQGVDACGNMNTCQQTITVNDTTPPVITFCPPAVTLPCGSNTTPFNPAVGYALATDNCGNIDATSTNVVTGACPGVQVITRTWTATDSCGNSDSCVQVITLMPAPSTCVPTTFASLGGGCGNPAPTLYTSIGSIADPLTLLVAGAPANAPIVIGAELEPFSVPTVFGSNCVLHIDPTAPATLLVEQVSDANGTWSQSFPLWMTPGLVNVNIRLQAGVLSNGILSLTGAVGFRPGTCPPFCTYEPTEWSGAGLPGAVYDASWLTVFPSGMDLGIFNSGNGNAAPNGLRFTGDVAGRVALKQTMATLVGVPGALADDATNPTSTDSGSLGTLTAALKLNIAFNAAGLLGSTPSFGSLVYVDSGDSLNGMTLTQILAVCNQALSGQGLPAGYTFDSLADLLQKLSVSHPNCTPSPWATTHLFLN